MSNNIYLGHFNHNIDGPKQAWTRKRSGQKVGTDKVQEPALAPSPYDPGFPQGEPSLQAPPQYSRFPDYQEDLPQGSRHGIPPPRQSIPPPSMRQHSRAPDYEEEMPMGRSHHSRGPPPANYHPSFASGAPPPPPSRRDSRAPQMSRRDSRAPRMDPPSRSRRDSVGTGHSRITPGSRTERELRRDDATIRDLRQQSASIRDSIGGLSMDGPPKSKSRFDDREPSRRSRRDSIAGPPQSKSRIDDREPSRRSRRDSIAGPPQSKSRIDDREPSRRSRRDSIAGPPQSKSRFDDREPSRGHSASIRESLGGLSINGPPQSKSRFDDPEPSRGHSRRDSMPRVSFAAGEHERGSRKGESRYESRTSRR